MICSNCGKEISDGSKFCGFCGAQQAAAPVAPVEAAPVAPVEAAPVAPVEAAPAAPVEAAPVAPVEAAPVAPVEAAPMQPMAGNVPPMQQPMAGNVPPMQQPMAGNVPPMQPMAGNVPPMQQPMAENVPPMQQPMAGNVPPMQGGMQPVSPIPPAIQEPKKKKGKAGLIVVIILLVVLLAGGGVFAFMWLNRPITKVAAAFSEGDMDKVVELYKEVGEKDKPEVEAQAKEYVMEMVDNYLSGAEDVDYETLSETLDALCSDILADDEEVAAKADIAKAVYASREAFEAAEEYKANGEYKEALESYANVIAEDKACYDAAQTAIAEVESQVRDEAIKEAKDCVGYSDYSTAKDVLNDALTILPDDADLLKELAAVEDAEVQDEVDDIIEEAEMYVSWGYYSDAITLLQAALEEYPGNADLTEALDAITEELYAQYPLLGKWSMEIDISDMIAEELGADAEAMETAFVINIIFEFLDDGTYKIYVDKEGFKDTFTVWLNEYIDYEIELMCDEYGVSAEEMDELFIENYGMTLKEYLNEAMEEELDIDALVEEATSGMEESGVYETDGDKLYMSEYYINYSSYDIFTVEGDTLTVSLEDGMEFESGVPGVEYPFTLTRVQ